MSIWNRSKYILSILAVLALIGLLMENWIMVLFLYMFWIGVAILWGVWRSVKKNPSMFWVLVVVGSGYAMLYVTLDFILQQDSVGDTGYFMGIVPDAAVYLLGILTLAIIASLAYMMIHDMKSKKLSED